MHRYFLHNDAIREASERTLSAGQTGLLNGWGVFSTMRVEDGIPFAFERHWERMRRDAQRIRVPFPEDPDWLRSRLIKLIQANGARSAVLRAAVVRNHGGVFEGPGIERAFDLIVFTADLAAWPESVRLGIKPQARHSHCEFAGLKVLSWSFNLAWYEEARQRGFNEMLLLNERGEVSECTSANLFVVEKDGRVWTPPLDSGCLPGVTRALLLEEVHASGITVGERTLMPADLARARGVLITSTTRDLLPVSAIEGLDIQDGGREEMAALEQALAEYRAEYLDRYRAPAQRGAPEVASMPR